MPRKERSLAQLRLEEETNKVLVVGKRLEFFADDLEEPFFFHLSMGLVRAKRFLAGENDALLTACGVRQGDLVLDATLGLGADAVLFSLATGSEGHVVSCESQLIQGFIVKEGLQDFKSESIELTEAAKRVEVVLIDHLTYLQSLPDKSFDIIYFDPMFRKTLEVSPGIVNLRKISDTSPLEEAAIEEAKRVAKRRIVLKERRYSNEFLRLGFQTEKSNRKILYGIIVLDE